MKKLQLNKRTIAQMDKTEMESVKGGICYASCKNGSRKGKKCCGSNGWDPGDAHIISLSFVKS